MKKYNLFTLLELLIVVAIISILLSILLPSLSKAREVAHRAVCRSNIAQNTRTMHLYAKDNNYKTWDSDAKHEYGLSINRFKSELYDMREFISPYAVPNKTYSEVISDDQADLTTWSCSSTAAPSIDHKDNTRTLLYMGMTYFPGNKHPFAQLIDDQIEPSWTNLPLNIGLLSNFIVQQDLSITLGINSGNNNYEFNHGNGRLETLVKNGVIDNTNPSFWVKKSSMKPAGSALGYGDGSAIWKNFNQLQDVGQWHRSYSDKRLFSLAPKN